MKNHYSVSSIKRISLIFLTITALGVTSSWLSSCSDTIAASSVDHTNIENRLTRIEAKLGNPQDSNGNVTSMANLTSKLSDDIGTMADRILEMADKIVETEVLIVQVITNQTTAATGTINTLTALKTDPSSTAPGNKLFANFDPNATPFVLNSILKGDVALKTPATLTVSLNTQPAITIFGNMPLTNYILVASLDARFVNPVQSEITVAANGTGVATDINVVWSNMVGANQLNIPVNANTSVFVAIRNLNTATGVVSKLSNSVAFIYN